MKQMIVLIYVFSLFLNGCKPTSKVTNNGDITTTDYGYITVIGIAKEDSKTGALVENDSDHRYFIDGLNEWPKNVYGKKVKVRGRCITVDQQKLMKKNPYRQGYPVKNTLENAKWKVVD